MKFDRCQVVRVVRVDIRRQDSALTCRLADTVLDTRKTTHEILTENLLVLGMIVPVILGREEVLKNKT